MDIILVTLRMHNYRAVRVVAIIPRAQKAHAKKSIERPALGKVVLIARAETDNKSETFAIFIGDGEKFTILKELWLMDIEAHTARIKCCIEAICCTLEVVAVLAIEHPEEEMTTTHTAPRREGGIDSNRRVRSHHCLHLRVYNTHNCVEGVQLGVNLSRSRRERKGQRGNKYQK